MSNAFSNSKVPHSFKLSIKDKSNVYTYNHQFTDV